MSWIVESNGQILWEPAQAVGYLFLDEIAGLERLVHQGSGVIDKRTNEMEIIPRSFDAFIQKVIDYLNHTNNGPLFAMVEGCFAICLVLNYRLTGCCPEVPDRLKPIVESAKTVMDPYPFDDIEGL